jgi:LAGLIDADG DNA endonuclease family protein
MLSKEYIAGYFDGEGCIQIEQDGSLCCRIKCNEAERFLRDIESLLREKDEQARVAIAYQDTRNRTRGIHSTNEKQDEQQELVARTRQKLTELKKQ